MSARLTNCSSLEQRGVIRFFLAESVKSSEILSRIQRQYGSSCISRVNFYKWVQAFKDGHESITDDPESGRPVDVSTPEAIQAVEDMIRSDRRVTFDEMATNLDIVLDIVQLTQSCMINCIQKSTAVGFPKC